MKKLFLLSGLFFLAATASGQVTLPGPYKQRPDKQPFRLYGTLKDSVIKVDIPGGLPLTWKKEKAVPAGQSALGPVYLLPQSNMPCIVPDMKEHTLMPNPGLRDDLLQLDPRMLIPFWQFILPGR